MAGLRIPPVLAAAVVGLCALAIGAPAGARAASPAEMRIDAPAGTQTVGAPFEVRVSITRAEAVWAGYTDQIHYDPAVLKVNSVRPGGIADCKDPNTWANPPEPEPGVMVAACVFQSTTATGVIEIIEFECIGDGASALHFVTKAEDPVDGSGLFDQDAVDIPTDLVDATVTCGAGGPIATITPPTAPVGTSSVPPGSTPGTGGTPGATSAPPTGGTPGSGATGATGNGAGTDGTAAPGTTAAAGPAATRAAATNTATAAKTASAQGSTQQTSDDGSGTAWWLIAVIIVVVLGAGGGAGWYMLQRRRSAGGG